MLSYRTF